MIIADLQIHSRHSRATSKDITLENLEKFARIKGLHLLGTGDMQHPKWNKEIKEKLKEDEHGILWSKTGFPFLWQTEVSLIYSQGGKGRRVHLLIFSPNGAVTDQIIEALGKKGRLDYDGRPIFGFSSIELVDMMISISQDIEIVPAHCMTPWFSLFGSHSGFDSIQECFEEKARHIHAIETGMSADPPMLRRISSLDHVNLVSFSDAHSFWPFRLGREATVFDTKLRYKDILHALRTGEGLKETIEVDPGYGKYHIDGHRACHFCCEPKETMSLKGICPRCKKGLTLGVAYRVEQLADRGEPKSVPPFKSLIPLMELITKVYGITQLTSKKVWEVYNKLIKEFGNEFHILLETSEKDLAKVVDPRLAGVILKNRKGLLRIKPGFDGVYGEVVLSAEERVQDKKAQKSLAEF